MKVALLEFALNLLSIEKDLPEANLNVKEKNLLHLEKPEKSMTGGNKIIRKVSIKNGKGYKSVTKYHKGKKDIQIKNPYIMSILSLSKEANSYLVYFQIVVIERKIKLKKIKHNINHYHILYLKLCFVL